MRRFISDQEIEGAPLSLTDLFDVIVEGFTLHGRGEFELPPKQGVHSRPKSFMHAMPAYLPTKDLLGAKLVSVYPSNTTHAPRPQPTTTGLIAMMDPETGVITDLLEAGWITQARTALVSMVDIAYLANPHPVFGVVGATGGSGRAHIEAIASIAPGSRVLVNSRSKANCDRLLVEYADLPIDLEIRMDYEAIVKECDVLMVCTSYLDQPIFEAEWMHAGQNIVNVHMRAWPSNITTFVDQVSCDNRGQVLDPHNGLTHLYPDLKPDFELGDVIAGLHPGRRDDSSVMFSVNYGLGTLDLLVADYVLRNL